MKWAAAGGGVTSGGTDNAILRADGTGGSTSQGSPATMADTTGTITLAACGQFIAGTGDCDTPGFTFIGDLNTGMFRPACHAVGWTTNGGERMRLCGTELRVGQDLGTANSKLDTGISICQGEDDNEILALKSSDVNHGVTCLTETDTFFAIKKASGSQGGVKFLIGSGGIAGYNNLTIITGCQSTGKDSGAGASISFNAGRAHATNTGYQAMNSNGNMMSLTCYDGTNNYRRFLWDAEGSAHAEVEWTTFDDYCDIELLRGVPGAMTPCYAPTYKETFGRDMIYNLEKYAELGLVGKNSMHWETREDGRIQLRGMVNTTSMMMLHHSTIIQMADRLTARIDGIETQLKALTEGK